jgi:FtsP/CotA-like multicopper oxidase with cupredoxin domain
VKLTAEDRGTVAFGAWVFALLAVLFGFVALWLSGRALTRADDARAAAELGGSATRVSLTEFAISPAMLHPGTDGKLVVVNEGKVEHDLAIKGTDLRTPKLAPGESAALDVGDLDDGTFEAFCTVAGHEGAGMRATVMVGSGSGASSVQRKLSRAANDAADRRMQEPIDEFVAQLTKGPNTKGVGNRPLPPTILPDGTKEFELTAEVIDWEVSPGQVVKAWAYNRQVPGPLIQVEPGDRVRVILHNKLPESTSIHFHGLLTPNSQDGVPGITQDPVKPGQTFVYEFVARGPAVGMYHSHHHADHQVPDGLLGAFLIGRQPRPPGVEVTQEIPMVLNDAGVIGLTLNGKSFPATAPIIARRDQWVEIHYFNEGLQIHPMHLHGLPQLVVAKDGFALPQPYLTDTLNVAPGERYSVLVQATEPGVWAFHCHILTHAERPDGRMFGMVTAFIVEE